METVSNQQSFNCYTFTSHVHGNGDDLKLRLTLILYKEAQPRSYVRSFINPFAHNIDTGNVMRYTIHQVGEMPDVQYPSI